eukprot:gene3267-6467_t
MSKDKAPISYSEYLNLVKAPLQVPPDNIKVGTCSMESDRFITICESRSCNITMIDLSYFSGNAITRLQMSAEAAIMNPSSRIIAVRDGIQLQLLDLENRSEVKSCIMPTPVIFWRWISSTAIALVTVSSVFHWTIEGSSVPVKIFDRHSSFTVITPIIGYQVSNDKKWCLLIGIAAGPGGVVNGIMQLYSIDKATTQMLQGHTGVFTAIKVPGRSALAQVLMYEDKRPDFPPKIVVMEVGREKNSPGSLRVSPQNLPMSPDATNDFLVSMTVSSKYAGGLAFMVSKLGFMYLVDVYSGKTIYRTRITTDTVFVTTEHTASGGVLGITARKGQVLHVTVNEANLIPYVKFVLGDVPLANALSTRLGLANPSEPELPPEDPLLAEVGEDYNHYTDREPSESTALLHGDNLEQPNSVFCCL